MSVLWRYQVQKKAIPPLPHTSSVSIILLCFPQDNPRYLVLIRRGRCIATEKGIRRVRGLPWLRLEKALVRLFPVVVLEFKVCIIPWRVELPALGDRRQLCRSGRICTCRSRTRPASRTDN